MTRLEEAQKPYQLDRVLAQLDRVDLLICDELGYLSFSRAGAELLFQVFADRYERRSLLVTSNLAFSEWGQVFQGERMMAGRATLEFVATDGQGRILGPDRIQRLITSRIAKSSLIGNNGGYFTKARDAIRAIIEIGRKRATSSFDEPHPSVT